MSWRNKVYTIQTSQGVITYTKTKRGGELNIKEASDGFINFLGHDVNVTIPPEMNRIRTGVGSKEDCLAAKLALQDSGELNKFATEMLQSNSYNMNIFDTDASVNVNSKKVTDEVHLIGTNVHFFGAERNVNGSPLNNLCFKNPETKEIQGDKIFVHFSKNSSVKAQSGDCIVVDKDCKGIKIDANEGTGVKVIGNGEATVFVHKSFDLKSKDKIVPVEIHGSQQTLVKKCPSVPLLVYGLGIEVQDGFFNKHTTFTDFTKFD